MTQGLIKNSDEILLKCSDRNLCESCFLENIELFNDATFIDTVCSISLTRRNVSGIAIFVCS